MLRAAALSVISDADRFMVSMEMAAQQRGHTAYRSGDGMSLNVEIGAVGSLTYAIQQDKVTVTTYPSQGGSDAAIEDRARQLKAEHDVLMRSPAKRPGTTRPSPTDEDRRTHSPGYHHNPLRCAHGSVWVWSDTVSPMSARVRFLVNHAAASFGVDVPAGGIIGRRHRLDGDDGRRCDRQFQGPPTAAG